MKLFSSYDGEKLYTVYLNEDEMKLYSKFKGSEAAYNNDRWRTAGTKTNKKLANNVFKKMNKDQINSFLNGEMTDLGNVSKEEMRAANNAISLNFDRYNRKHNHVDTLAQKTGGKEALKKRLEEMKTQPGELNKFNSFRAKQAAKNTPAAVNPAHVSTPVPQPKVIPAQTKQVAANTEKQVVNNAAKKNASYLGKGLKFAKNHKLGVGLGAAGLVTAGTGAYLYNKNKNKQ